MHKREKGGKTAVLSLRLEPKTKFLVELMARVTGMSITSVVEKAVKQMAETVISGPEWDGKYSSGWKSVWSTDDGIRTIRTVLHPAIRGKHTSFDEDELIEFMWRHPHFFSAPCGGMIAVGHLREDCIAVLWPKIHEYVAHWKATRAVDPEATGELMREALRKARVWVPQATPLEDERRLYEVLKDKFEDKEEQE